jgi:hypothetical protein
MTWISYNQRMNDRAMLNKLLVAYPHYRHGAGRGGATEVAEQGSV